MLKKEQLESYLQKCLELGADFAEIYEEESTTNTITMQNSKIDSIKTNISKGIGIRLTNNNDKVYGYTNHLDDLSIISLIENLTSNFKNNPNPKLIKLDNLTKYQDKVEISHNAYSKEDKKNLLKTIDTSARNKSDKINQVEVKLIEDDKLVKISNSNNIYKQDKRINTNLIITIYATDKINQEKSYKRLGYKQGYEFLKTLDLESIINDLTKSTIDKLNAIECPSGKMPVVIANGFGGVIFHEACGHSLEATTVSKGTSAFSNLLNTNVATKKVTLKDNALIPHAYGSNNIDDEGNICKENILIENGILKSYLIDNLNSKTMNQESTSSGRRESYKYSPTSRMSNTYLEKGTDKVEDMIKSIKFGLYATDMGGGSVNPMTGDFNFVVLSAYLIENGKITKPVKGASLIGNGKDILKQVSMVSDDLELSPGWCGSVSGSIPVTVGMPTIKVDSILVGGKGEKINEL